MLRIILPAVLVGTATFASAETPADVGARTAQNWEVMFSQYPPGALAAGEQGVVGFQVELDRDGFATECQVTQFSGYERLDGETCRLVMNRAVFKGFIDADGRRQAVVTQGVVNWILPTQPAGSEVRIAQAASMPRFGMVNDAATTSGTHICKRQRTTGSLAGYKRICMTSREWALQQERHQQEWGELQGSKGSTNGR